VCCCKNLSNLPFNVIGNIVGYVALIFAGSPALFYYEQARTYGKTHEIFVGVVGVVIILLLVLLYKFWGSKFQEKAKRVIIFASGFFVIALLLFLGLGNITTRYAYLPSVAILILFVYAIQNLYMVLTKSNKIVGIVMVSVVIGFFCWYQYSQLQKLNTDWHNAGEVTSQVMKNFNDVFQVAKITPQNPVFYFVNVPIRKGEAWIFPVGLPDALWFTFQNENLTVKTTSTLNMALDASEGSTSARVFEFKKNGDIEEVVRSSE
jgi:4-amino-4-deoxy-L-arabinose transferase-like glycosyltransferase